MSEPQIPIVQAANLRKHGIDFEDAGLVFFDPRALVREDTEAKREQRLVAVGADAPGRVLTVVSMPIESRISSG